MSFRVSLLLVLASTSSCRPADRAAAHTDTVRTSSASPDSTEAAGSPGAPLTSGDFVVVGLHALMDSMAVVRLLGGPDSVSIDHDSRAPGAKLVSWHYRDLTVLLGSANSVGGFWITGPAVPTARGLKVGDTQERVKELYGVPEDEFAGEWEYSYEGRFTGRIVLRVSFLNGRVQRLYLGHLYD